MSELQPTPTPTPLTGPPTGPLTGPPAAPRATARPGTVADLRVAAAITIGLAALGAVLGVVWSAWAGPQQRAYVISPGALYPFDEVETRAGADARFFVIVASVGILAGLLGWLLRPANRGPLVLLGLCLGTLAGAALTAWVGHLTGGGTYSGKTGTIIAHLPVSLHMDALLFVGPALAALIYGMFAAFAVHDDLGHPDPARRLAAPPVEWQQHGWPRPGLQPGPPFGPPAQDG